SARRESIEAHAQSAGSDDRRRYLARRRMDLCVVGPVARPLARHRERAEAPLRVALNNRKPPARYSRRRTPSVAFSRRLPSLGIVPSPFLARRFYLLRAPSASPLPRAQRCAGDSRHLAHWLRAASGATGAGDGAGSLVSAQCMGTGGDHLALARSDARLRRTKIRLHLLRLLKARIVPNVLLKSTLGRVTSTPCAK